MDAGLSLADRRARLLAQSAAQRRRIGLEIEPWRKPLEVVDQGVHLVRLVRAHPLWFLGSGVLLLLVRQRAATALLRNGWLGWLMLRNRR